MGEQALKRRNILTPVTATNGDWYRQPVRFASFIPPGRYSIRHPRDIQLHYLAELTGATLRRVRSPNGPNSFTEIELAFRSNQTGESTRPIVGGLDLATLPAVPPEEYVRGWQVPFSIGNPGFFESYDEAVNNPPTQRTFYGFHLDGQNR